MIYYCVRTLILYHCHIIVYVLTGSSKVNQAIWDNFTAAVNCWNFLYSNMTYNKGIQITRTHYNVILYGWKSWWGKVFMDFYYSQKLVCIAYRNIGYQ